MTFSILPSVPADEPQPTEYQRRLLAQRARIQDSLDDLEQSTVKGFRGGRYTVTEARRLRDACRSRVDEESARGSHKHHRVSAGMRRVPWLSAFMDFSLVYLFLAVILNVRLDAPLDTPAEALTTLLLSLLVTLGLLVILRWFGARRRTGKNDAGRYEPPDGEGAASARFETTLIVALLTGAALLMGVRVVNDAQDAGVSDQAVWVIAGFLALITAALNWVVLTIEFHDGSVDTHELDWWSRRLEPFEKQEARLRRRIREVDGLLAAAGARPPERTTPDDAA